MFSKLSLLALVAPLVSSLTINVPENPTSGGSVTIKWGSAQNDPDTFSFELLNTIFNNAFAIANNVNPTAGQLTITLPIVPVGDGYTLQAVNIGNITDVFATSASFSIGAATTSSSSSSSSTASISKSSSRSGTGIVTPVTTPTPVTSNIVSNTASSSTPPGTTAGSTSGTSGGTPSSTPFNSGALTSRLGLSTLSGGITVVLLSAAAAMLSL